MSFERPTGNSVPDSSPRVCVRGWPQNAAKQKRDMSTPFSPEMVALCRVRLAEITEADTNALTQFAECRLVAVGAPPSCGEDVTQRAFQALLMGLETDRGGRRPRLVDINNKPDFLNYMRGIISSLVYSMTRTTWFRVEAQIAGRDSDLPDLEKPTPAEHAELRDLGDELFPRLRARAPRRLLPTIEAWKDVFLESDRIPSQGQRKYAHEVRVLARKILKEVGESPKA